MERHVAGRALTLRHAFEGDDGEDVITPSSAVTVIVTPVGASSPVASGSATSPTGASVAWTFTTPPLTEGVYTVEWDGGDGLRDTEYIEVAGRRIFTLRTFRKIEPDITVDRFSAARVSRARQHVEDEFERITGRSFIPVTRRVRIDADGRDAIWIGRFDTRRLVAMETLAGSPVDTSGLDLDQNGVLTGLSALRGSYVATIAYGMLTVPGDVERAAILRARTLLVNERGGVPDRATSFQPVEGGTYTLATPGLGRWKTGIPDVDAVLAGYTYEIADALLEALP